MSALKYAHDLSLPLPCLQLYFVDFVFIQLQIGKSPCKEVHFNGLVYLNKSYNYEKNGMSRQASLKICNELFSVFIW